MRLVTTGPYAPALPQHPPHHNPRPTRHGVVGGDHETAELAPDLGLDVAAPRQMMRLGLRQKSREEGRENINGGSTTTDGHHQHSHVPGGASGQR